MIVNENYDTQKRQDGDYNLYISNLNSKTCSMESSLGRIESLDKTMSLSILSKDEIYVNLSEIIALYDQIDHKLFVSKKCYQAIRSEQLYYDNIDQIKNQRIVLQVNNQSSIFQGYIKENRQLIVQKIIKVYQNDILVQKLDEYKIHHLINQNYPQKSLQLINPVMMEKNQQYYLLNALMERAKFNLYEYSRKFKISSQQAYFIFKTIIEQIIAIHKLKIAHRDIKPQNILFVQDKGWLITDFGESQVYEEVHSFYTIRGTKYFLIPALQSQINLNKKIEQNLLENDLYALVVTIIMIQSNEYIRDMELKVTNISEDHFKQILNIKSLKELIRFQDYNFKEEIQINFNTTQPIYKEMNIFEELNNDYLTQLSWPILYQFYNDNQINSQLCRQILELISKCKFVYYCNPYKPYDRYLPGIQITEINPIDLARKKLHHSNNIEQKEQIISLLFIYGYNEKTIFYATQILRNIYSQKIHLFLIQSYQRAHLFEEADQQIALFNQGLLFDQLNTNVQLSFFLLESQRIYKKNQKVYPYHNNLKAQLNNFDVIQMDTLDEIYQEISQYFEDQLNYRNHEDDYYLIQGEKLADKLMAFLIQLCNKFTVNNYYIYANFIYHLEKSIPIQTYIQILNKMFVQNFELIDLNRKAILIYVLGQSFIYLNKIGKSKSQYKQFQKLILRSDSCQQIVSLKYTFLLLRYFNNMVIYRNILFKLNLILIRFVGLSQCCINSLFCQIFSIQLALLMVNMIINIILRLLVLFSFVFTQLLINYIIRVTKTNSIIIILLDKI